MSVQTAEIVTGRNPATAEEARAFVKHVESLFMPWNVDGLADGFTEDCVVRFGTMPEMRGREAVRRFFESRSRRQRNYRLTKELRALSGDTMANHWTGEWEDAVTGERMVGRGVEIWIMRAGRIAVWEAAFNFAQADAADASGGLLGD